MMIRPALREYRTWTSDSRRWDGYEPRRGYIIITTSPKCGTTWMQQIVGSLVFQGSVCALPDVSPWIEARFFRSDADMHASLARQPHRRFLKTHLPLMACRYMMKFTTSMSRATDATRSCRCTTILPRFPISASPGSIASDWKTLRLACRIRGCRRIRPSIFASV